MLKLIQEVHKRHGILLTFKMALPIFSIANLRKKASSAYMDINVVFRTHLSTNKKRQVFTYHKVAKYIGKHKPILVDNNALTTNQNIISDEMIRKIESIHFLCQNPLLES